jgi:hypothetical protein
MKNRKILFSSQVWPAKDCGPQQSGDERHSSHAWELIIYCNDLAAKEAIGSKTIVELDL